MACQPTSTITPIAIFAIGIVLVKFTIRATAQYGTTDARPIHESTIAVALISHALDVLHAAAETIAVNEKPSVSMGDAHVCLFVRTDVFSKLDCFLETHRNEWVDLSYVHILFLK